MILDQFGREYSTVKTPERRPLAAAPLSDMWREYVCEGLTPQRLAAIFKEADAGDLRRQAELFEQMEEKDAHLQGETGKRWDAILDEPWRVTPASDDARDVRVAEFVEDYLKNLTDFDDILVAMQTSIGRGFSAFDLAWDVSEGQALPEQIESIEQKRFTFVGQDGMLRRTPLLLSDRSPMGEEIPAWRTVFHVYGGKTGSPTRAKIYRVSAWMFLFKNYSIKDWVTFCEVFGMPLRIGKYDAGASQDDKEALVAAISSLGTDAAGIISKSTEIEIKETVARAANSRIYSDLAGFCNREMSKAILGQTLTAEVGDKGSYAAGKVHNEVRKDLAKADRRATAATIRRQLLRPMVGFNFGWDTAVPGFGFFAEEQEDLDAETDRLDKLVKMGMRIPVAHVRKKFNIPEPEKNEECLGDQMRQIPAKQPEGVPIVAKENGTPSRASQGKDGAHPIEDQLQDAAAATTDEMINQVKVLVVGAPSLEHVRDHLLDTYQGMDITDLAELIRSALTAAELSGRYEVMTEEVIAAKIETQAVDLPFDEAIEFYRQKLKLGAERWTDLWEGMHARAFTVAGAQKEELLCDFYDAVDKAVSQGTTLQEFRRDFDNIVARHGWDYNGSRGWRSRVIYGTNLRTARAAGRYKQMRDPDVLKLRPYWIYRHGDTLNPRPEHLAWHDLVLAADDPWWLTHYPPNGWGCECNVFSASRHDLERMGKSGPDTAPEIRRTPRTVKQLDPETGELCDVVHMVPEGIDAGWDYNVGQASYGRSQSLRLMDETGPWKDLGSWGPQAYGRPAKLIPEESSITSGPRAYDETSLRNALREAIGGDMAHYTDPAGAVIEVNQGICDHIMERPENRMDGRECWFPFIPELITDPHEVWVSFAVSELSGRVAVRRRYVKALRVGNKKVIGLWAEFEGGQWASGDFFRGGLTGAGNLRKGRMVYGKE